MSKLPIMLVILLLMAPLTGVGIDIYVPSLPWIAKYFAADPTYVRLTVGAYLLGYGVSQPFFGFLIDHYGRKPFAIGGMSVLVLISLIIPISPNISMLLLLRFIQGICVAPSGILCRTLLSDCYKGKTLLRYTNYMTAAWAMGPITAPFIGGYLQHYFSWRAPFYFLAIYCFMLLIMILFFMEETLKVKTSLIPKEISLRVKAILTHKAFLAAVCCLGLTYSMMVIFNVVGPFIVQVVLHYSPVTYGKIALLMGLGWFLGNVFNRILSRWVFIEKLIAAGFILGMLSSAVILLLGFNFLNLWVLVIPVFFLLMMCGMILANCYGLALSHFAHYGGLASSVVGTIISTFAGLMGVLASFLETDSQVPLALAYIILMFIGCVVYFSVLRQSINNPE